MILAACFSVALLAQAPVDDALSVEVVSSDGEQRCSIRALDAPLPDLLALLAARAELQFTAADPELEPIRITAELDMRPLHQALAYVLGGTGRRAVVQGGVLSVRALVDADTSARELYDRASATYLHVLREFPEHALAPEAELGQARLEEQRGEIAAARAHYALLIQNYPDSPWVPEALARNAQLAMREHDYGAAALQLSKLLRSPATAELEAQARLDLARCTNELGQYDRALYMLDALELTAPASEPDAALDRARVRVRALVGVGRSEQALALLERLEREDSRPDARRVLLHLRALAGDAAGRAADAARAWLAYSRFVDGDERAAALANAARQALTAGDELGTLFVERLAQAEVRDVTQLQPFADEARAQLVLTEAELREGPPAQQLSAAERCIAAGFERTAFELLSSVATARASLDARERLRFDLAYARLLAERAGVAEAVGVLRAGVEGEPDAQARKSRYLLAAELLETANRTDEAIEALEGKL